MTEVSPRFPTNPPHFRKTNRTPAELLLGRCEKCESYANIGFCAKYQTPVEEDNVCDGYVSIMRTGKRQWAER